MLVIGLTGSIGMGKSTAAAQFARRGVPVFDADAEVHRLYAGPAVPAVAELFPDAVRGGEIDRARLAEEVAGAPERLRALEALVHPMVAEAEIAFLHEAESNGAEFAMLEIPLLFEVGAERRADVTVVVSAPAAMQRERALARPGMTAEKLDRLMARQMPDVEKRARADYVVDSSVSLDDMQRQIDKILDSLRGRKGRVMERLRHA